MNKEDLEKRAVEIKMANLEKDNARLRNIEVQHRSLKYMYEQKQDELLKTQNLLSCYKYYPKWFRSIGNFLFKSGD